MKSIAAFALLTFTVPLLAEVDTLPAPLKLLTDEGGKIVSEFEAPAKMKGYIADLNGQIITLYVTPDEQYLFTGAMLDVNGNNLGAKAANEYASGPKAEQDWKTLENSHWVRDGSASAKRIVYTFSDPNCPYCKQFWQNARPWIASGDVQIRHIFVGILKEDSLGKAAAILAADNPAEILHKFGDDDFSQTLKPLQNPTEDTKNKLQVNHQAMMSLGVSATPATFYHDNDGAAKMQMGLPPEALMEEILGPRANK